MGNNDNKGIKNAKISKSVPASTKSPGTPDSTRITKSGSQVSAAEVAAGLKKAGRAGRKLAIAKHARRG